MCELLNLAINFFVIAWKQQKQSLPNCLRSVSIFRLGVNFARSPIRLLGVNCCDPFPVLYFLGEKIIISNLTREKPVRDLWVAKANKIVRKQVKCKVPPASEIAKFALRGKTFPSKSLEWLKVDDLINIFHCDDAKRIKYWWVQSFKSAPPAFSVSADFGHIRTIHLVEKFTAIT